MTFRVKNPLSKPEAFQKLALLDNGLVLDQEMIEQNGCWMALQEPFKQGDLVLVRRVSDDVLMLGGLCQWSAWQDQVAVVVGRTYSDKLKEDGPYLLALRNHQQGYAHPEDMKRVRPSNRKWLEKTNEAA